MTAYAAICDEGNLHKIAYRLQRDDEFDGYMLGTYFKHDIHLYYNKLHGTFARITYGIEDFLC